MVSVVVATRNDAATIYESITSILNQSYTSLEVIVVDDASDDGTEEIVEKLAAVDSRVRVVVNKARQGTGKSRNKGILIATGQYITFQDGDDTSLDNRIALQMAAFDKHPGAKLVLCNYVRVNEKRQSLLVNDKRTMKCIISMMFRREEVLDKVGLFREESVSEDADYYERIKAAFGPDSEVVIFRTLYRALFRRHSAFFSSAHIVEASGRRLLFERSEDAIRRWREMQAEHSEMRSGVRSPRIYPNDND
ncbi:glycosyltransferase involved in cell wall biosynthesis [Rhizobium soli]|uniref:Glycosyltransferase involved in cell wall biosynthesis n=1 Tax=Rhizobium soli TaxID=424798 RepID=A0A7X0JQM3_9HYPH|nr:glycosyltransferase family A protein [Rhizobium soli]MBB6511091.1 glycosyltransferase involved in cell wall biosynthesis [Rhizobium soli]